MGPFWPNGIIAPMSETINPELFYRLVYLAALQLDEKEAEYLRAELNKQLQAIDELAAIPIDESTAATSHGVPYPLEIRPAIREDKIAASEAADEILRR
jgi:aspartyl-tRNA(Asn)/glutamyl-tRNA(Gln) amidotransferase subunit C